MYRHFFKRFIGFWISLIALICFSPILLVTTIWLCYANKGAGSFFFQERPGKDGKIFKVIKFKTMTDERDENGKLLPDVKRLTKVGQFVRSTSIDELPQLINVLKGDMAIIGPRPLYVRYLPYYTEREHLRHSVRPGISGWAQCHGRKSITWTEKLNYDVEYVENLSLRMDINIAWTTIKQVLARENVGVATSGTNDFNDYRDREWAAQGRQDLIEKASKAVEKLNQQKI
jgi:lipopolysaccharide/colanic/teichoic acid biosynthesis glycosyltransferase